MKYRWNDVDVTEEEYNRRWKEWLEYLKANEEKEEEERRGSRKKIQKRENWYQIFSYAFKRPKKERFFILSLGCLYHTKMDHNQAYHDTNR